MAEPQDLFCVSHDGRLRLYGRAYGPVDAARTILCLHGLTRNSLDFDALARRLSAAGERVLSFDQRGRGRSGWDDDAANYRVDVYVRDMLGALDQLGVERAILIGTSMGGLMSMLMASSAPERVAAMVLNDIGPEVDPRGVERIRSYVGKRPPPASWDDAARAVARDNAIAFPDYGHDDWLAAARRTFVEDAEGRPVAAYDPAIAVGLKTETTAAVADLWPMWDGLKAFPILAIRGELSDLFSQSTLEQMAARHPGLQTAIVPLRGHAPMLDEPVALAAIDRFLAGLPNEGERS
jgi:pimeloyl-ACP methyl ester carboxylesterase